MVSKHDEFDDFLNDDDDSPVIDTRADGRLLRVPLNRLSPNGVNPRKDFGTEAELEDFGRSLKRRQIQALPVVTRTAYLKLWSGHEEQIGNVDFVIVSGERRFRSASAVGLSSLECVINDAVAETKKTFLDAVVSENIDRQNFDAIEEANAVDVLVEAFGTARAVAEHYERGDAWVSQRRVLLRLAPGVQDLVRRRDLPLEYARKLGKLVKDHDWDEAEQLGWWVEEQRRQRQKKDAAAEARRTPPVERAAAAPQEVAPSFTAVKTKPKADRAPEQPAREQPLRKAVPEPEQTEAALPEPRQGGEHPAAVVRPQSASTAEPGTEWELPAGVGWESVLNSLMAQMGEFDRHMLTRGLNKAMEEELGANADGGPSESASA
ncbi:ParB/RepB/Spo0J family partition protein (plasmid) [Streptomyces sp. NBC_01259]|uniref:ParB/RepB/Spo0J family partition protein n=1 Tax=Streptomyces sp. NBC_01259 TaxID=2903800 RepID=UPI002F917F96